MSLKACLSALALTAALPLSALIAAPAQAQEEPQFRAEYNLSLIHI